MRSSWGKEPGSESSSVAAAETPVGKRAPTDRLQLRRSGPPPASADATVGPLHAGIVPGVSFVDTLTAPVQRERGDAGAGAGDAGVQAAATHGVSGPAERLPYLDSIQHAFGHHDVGGVAAHTDAAAAAGSRAMGAAAFASGHHVAFAGAPDLHTAAHEAAHVVQQRGGVQLAGGVGQAGDPYERHADAVADAVVAGRPAEALLDAGPGAGPTAAAPHQATGAVQRQEGGAEAPAAADPFEHGTFLGWPMIIVPDDHHGRLPRTNWIYRRLKTRFEALFAVVEGGSGRIRINETAPDGTAFPGFRDKILKAIKRLMTVVPGRELIQQLEDGGQDVTIQADPTVRASANATARTGTPGNALRNADGTPGAGTTSTVFIDPNQSNRTQRVFDRDGNETSFPLFINLGHEMIHAMHNQRGENERNTAATDASYSNREEELTIDGPGLSENRLRRSFGLTERHGHGGTTTAHSTSTVSGGATGG
jgi:hypothetical protein